MLRYFIANKPFNTICQFTPDVEGQKTLADLDFDLPKDVYAIGRLDMDSEGLLLLSNDRSLNHKLLNPQFAHDRTYLSLIENVPNEDSLNRFRAGLSIKVEKKNYDTLPAQCRQIEDPSVYFDGNPVWERVPKPKSSANQPMSWLEVCLTEGKNRQVRKMCAAIGHPCLRLIRVKIKDLELGNLQPNVVLELERSFVYEKIGLSNSMNKTRIFT
jgi:23S rRNA pseudouridine2457 synthase